jgi:hypothetical protein
MAEIGGPERMKEYMEQVLATIEADKRRG